MGDESGGPVLRRPRGALLLCGIAAAGVGAAMILVSDRVAGLFWLAVPIAVLGLVLLGCGLWPRAAEDAAAGSPPQPLPGRWYPFAILGLFAALVCWAIIWTKPR